MSLFRRITRRPPTLDHMQTHHTERVQPAERVPGGEAADGGRARIAAILESR